VSDLCVVSFAVVAVPCIKFGTVRISVMSGFCVSVSVFVGCAIFVSVFIVLDWKVCHGVPFFSLIVNVM
jgi:hypothetical protein